MTAKRLLRHQHLLRAIALGKLTPSQLKGLLSGAPPDTIRCLSDCAYNILHRNVSLNISQKKKLIKHKNTLRQLAEPKYSIKKKKELLVNQRGGFLPLILAPILGILSTLAGRGIAKALKI